MDSHPLLINLQSTLRSASSEPEAIALLRAAARQGLTRASAIDALTAWRAGVPEPLDDRLCAALDVATGWCAPQLRPWRPSWSGGTTRRLSGAPAWSRRSRA